MSRRSRSREIPVTVLTVCIGNICRSPLAEQLLRAQLAGDDRFEFGGAGLHTRDGIPMDQESAGRSLFHGGNPEGALSSSLVEGHARSADLILTMTVGQRDELLSRHPFALRRAFTLAEFTALAGALAEEGQLPQAPATPTDIREFIALASGARALAQLGKDDDVPDPVNASAEVHRQVAEQIAGYTAEIAKLLASTR